MSEDDSNGNGNANGHSSGNGTGSGSSALSMTELLRKEEQVPCCTCCSLEHAV